MNQKISLEDATINALSDFNISKKEESALKDTYNSLGSSQHNTDNSVNTDGVEGLIDGVLIVTDPTITTTEYEEVIERAQEIVDGTPEGSIPFSEDYLGDYIQTCPSCGMTFVEDHILEAGSACPICLEEPDGFVLVGRVESEEEVIEDKEVAKDPCSQEGELTPDMSAEQEVAEEQEEAEGNEEEGNEEEVKEVEETKNMASINAILTEGTALAESKEVESLNIPIAKMDFLALTVLVDEKIAADVTDAEFNTLIEELANNEVITAKEYTTLLNKIQDTRRVDESANKIEEAKLDTMIDKLSIREFTFLVKKMRELGWQNDDIESSDEYFDKAVSALRTHTTKANDNEKDIERESRTLDASNSGFITSAQGKFYIGDICYVLSDDIYNGIWGDEEKFRDGKIDTPEGSFWVHSTAYGDGEYKDNEGHAYPVDAGVIGIVPMELVARPNRLSDGRVVNAKTARLEYEDSQGTIIIMYDNDVLFIPTRYTGEEDNEEYDEYAPMD